MEINHVRHTGYVIQVPPVHSTERAVCELCGDVIATVNGGRHSGLSFLTFERLLAMHMEQRHANLCVLPASGEYRQAA
jgi:hypothetical protein